MRLTSPVELPERSPIGGVEAAVARRHGISRDTLYRWRRKYGDMEVSDAKRLRDLEEENRRLKRIEADQAVNLQVLENVLGKEW